MVCVAPLDVVGHPKRTMSRRDILIGAAVLIVAFLGALMWLRQPQPTRPVDAPGEIAAAPEAAAPAPEPFPPPLEPDARLDRPPPREGAPPNPRSERAARVAQLRRRALFPPTSQPIDDGLDPISQQTIPEPERSGPPDEPGQHLITYPAVTSVEAPAGVTVYAEVVELDDTPREEIEGDPQELRVAPRVIRGDVRDPSGQPASALAFRDDGREGDAVAGDLQFTATYTPDPDAPGGAQGTYTVEVAALTDADRELSATTRFFYSAPAARLTGQYRDALVEGHLQIEAEVEVESPGQFRVEGTLASGDAAMLGYAQQTMALEAGTAWVPLTFWGLILREQNVDGPYNLFNVALSTIGETEAQPSNVVGNAHWTAPYKAADFSDEPFNDPELLEEAERLAGRAG